LKVEVIIFKKETTLLRLYGGTSKAIGRYYFCCLWPADTDSGNARTEGLTRFWSDASRLATPPDNLLNHLAKVTIPAGTTAIIGTVADNFADQLGTEFPFQEYPFAGNKGGVSEIVLQLDDRILRISQ
jgi:hypothetical protein